MNTKKRLKTILFFPEKKKYPEAQVSIFLLRPAQLLLTGKKIFYHTSFFEL